MISPSSSAIALASSSPISRIKQFDGRKLGIRALAPKVKDVAIIRGLGSVETKQTLPNENESEHPAKGASTARIVLFAKAIERGRSKRRHRPEVASLPPGSGIEERHQLNRRFPVALRPPRPPLNSRIGPIRGPGPPAHPPEAHKVQPRMVFPVQEIDRIRRRDPVDLPSWYPEADGEDRFIPTV